jgi:hypothetical protein
MRRFAIAQQRALAHPDIDLAQAVKLPPHYT